MVKGFGLNSQGESCLRISREVFDENQALCVVLYIDFLVAEFEYNSLHVSHPDLLTRSVQYRLPKVILELYQDSILLESIQ